MRKSLTLLRALAYQVGSQRNIERFPQDFMFQLTKEELEILKCQNGIASWGGDRHLPYAFTENGVAMLSGVLRSGIAIEVNIRIMRAFTTMRHFLANNAQLFQRLSNVEYHQIETDRRIDEVFNRLEANIQPQQGIFFDGQVFDAYLNVFQNTHDRFLCIDDTVYHIGASLKDLGKRWFAFSRMEIETNTLLQKM